MARPIKTHITGPCQEDVRIAAIGKPGPGGAHHRYTISIDKRDGRTDLYGLLFQSGPLAAGANGITNEALLAILIDRLQSFSAGPNPCCENEAALEHLRSALAILHARTRRLSREADACV